MFRLSTVFASFLQRRWFKLSRKPRRYQKVLFEETLEDKVEKSPHAARFFLYIAKHLYIPFYEVKNEGAPPYDRVTLVALILFGFYKGNFSQQSIIDMHEDSLGANWLLKGMTLPCARTVKRVINQIKENIGLIFIQIIELCELFNLIGGERYFIDGTKTRANASKHKAMSYKYLCKKLKTTEAEITNLTQDMVDCIDEYKDLSDKKLERIIISAAESIHQEAKSLHQKQLKAKQEAIFSGKEPLPVEQNSNNKEAKVNSDRLKLFELIDGGKNEQAQEVLEDMGHKLSRQETMNKAKDDLETAWKKEHRNKPIPDKQQINFTDPESQIMVTKHHGVQQCYNNFAMVDQKAHIIVGAYTSNCSNDKQALIPTIENARNYINIHGVEIGVDAGFFSADNIRYGDNNNIDLYISVPQAESSFAKDKFKYDEENDIYLCPEDNELTPPDRFKEGAKSRIYKTDKCLECPSQSDCTKAKDGIRKIVRDLEGDPLREKAEIKANTEIGKEILSQRKAVSEPVWGNMKNQDGLVQLHSRGLDNAGNEFILRCLMHNLRKLYKVYKNNPQARNKIENMEANTCQGVA